MNGFNSTLAHNLLTIKDLVAIYDKYCPDKGSIPFDVFVMEFLRINPNYKLI